ncbi:MAG TPA: proteasome subunit beta [Candidatus Manganitrophaceae bacterium]|nr:proteasome subunit beta [Candidatus Manganitrophaceae bacterium]
MPLFQFHDPGSSFYQLLTSQYPQLLPRLPGYAPSEKKEIAQMVPHGTTVLAIRYREGVVIAGDRMATEGYSVSERRIEKVHKTDHSSAIAIAGAAGPCLELTRLFQIELEHYEKLEGAELSMEGKANKLAQMIKANLPMAMQGLVVIPIFAGYDVKRETGRIFKYDIAGGQYEEAEYYAIGSGGKDARGTMKKIFKKDLSEEEAIRVAVEALYDAAEADIATGGPDLTRGIFPTVKVIKAQGVIDVEDERTKRLFQELIQRQGGGL